MGFSGIHIPGHSGTQFKHRKVFERIKKYEESTKYSEIEIIQTPIKKTSRSVTKEPTKRDPLLMYISMLLVATLFVYVTVHYYSKIYSMSSSISYEYDEKLANNKSIREISQIEEGLKWGCKWLQNGHLTLSENNYKDVLSLQPNNEEALWGLTQIEEMRTSLMIENLFWKYKD